MRIEVNTDQFRAAFSEAAAAIAKRSPKEVLRHVRVSAVEGRAELVATDTEVTVVRSMTDVTCPSGGVCLLPAERVQKILAAVEGEQLTITVDDNRVRLKCGSADFRIAKEDPDMFPPMDVFKPKQEWHVDARALLRAMHQTVWCTDEASTRYALGGVCLEVSDGEMRCVATDSRKLAVSIVGAAESAEPWRQVIPSKAVQRILTALNTVEGTVTLQTEDNRLRLITERTKLVTMFVVGRFPNWRSILEPTKRYSLRGNCAADPMLSAIRRVTAIATREQQGTDFRFDKGELFLDYMSEDGDGDSQTSLPIVFTPAGPIPPVIRMNAAYVVGTLQAALKSDPVVEFAIQDEDAPVVFEAGGGVFRGLIMPMEKG